MNGFHRLHQLRMENDAAGYAMEEMRPRFDRIAGRHGNGTAPVAVSAYQLFQTPVPIATHLAELLDLKSMPRPFRMLEPSAGLGRLLDALLPYDPAMVQAVEIATPLCAELYRQDRAKVNLHQRDFLTMTPGDTGFFDAVIMNPPFHMRSDIKHLLHALTFLKPGGKLAAICMAGPHREAQLRPLASKWISLDPATFAETGTRIQTAMLLITKR